jgi:hypothetical protein
MVHALQEVWRVLKPDATLIDLRPTSEPVHLGLLQANGFTPIAVPEEDFEDYRAAETALAQTMDLRLFVHVSTSQFPLITTFPSLEGVREWLHDFYESMPVESSEKLVRVVDEAVGVKEAPVRIVAVVPFTLSVLRKSSSG